MIDQDGSPLPDAVAAGAVGVTNPGFIVSSRRSM